MLQTIHKLYINYTLKRSKPYTKRHANPTQNGVQTLHKREHKPYIATEHEPYIATEHEPYIATSRSYT